MKYELPLPAGTSSMPFHGAWPAASQVPPRFGESSETHVWAAALDLSGSALAALAATLAPEELDRASRFRFPIHQRRFVAARGSLRGLLAVYLGLPPQKLEFSTGLYGKPELAHGHAGRPLHFNLSHTENLALIAVTQAAEVGVDLERLRTFPDADDLVARFFSPHETEAYRALPLSERPLAFLHLWTRKEAWLKAKGEGIGHSLHRVEVELLPGKPAALKHLPTDLGQVADWSLHHLQPAADFVGALAVRWPQITIRCFRWEPELLT
jgi:4'-phosphopantetheinyl transferase